MFACNLGTIVAPDNRKKRLATQRKTLQHGSNHSSSDTVQANRRPPPLPPGTVPVGDKARVLKGPALPRVPHPRPISAYDHTQGSAIRPNINKSVSMDDIPRVVSAEGTVNTDCIAGYCLVYILTANQHLGNGKVVK